jgi:hypothetical protein
MGTLFSRATCLIRSAINRSPLAVTLGALIVAESYSIATATWSGLVITTFALGTAAIIRARLSWRILFIIALRTSTHAFKYERDKASPYAKYDWHSQNWPGGFGQQVLGETWINHHGAHGKESTRGVINEPFKSHPILRSVTDIWGPTDVYSVVNLPKDAQVLLWGQVLSGMKPTDAPVEGPKNNPMMPVVWLAR